MLAPDDVRGRAGQRCLSLFGHKPDHHRLKASDLRRAFRDEWARQSPPMHGVGAAEPRGVPGPSHRSMTFGPVLCTRCNTTETQPFDRAYDRFIDGMFEHREVVLKERSIDFSVVYGDDWEQSQLNLFRYFTKHLGCNIARLDGHTVPRDLREVLHRSPFQTYLRVTLDVHEDTLIVPDLDGGLFLGSLAHWPPGESGIPAYYSHCIVGWLMIAFWYNLPPSTEGTQWIANAQAVHLGRHAPLTEDERVELRRRASGGPVT